MLFCTVVLMLSYKKSSLLMLWVNISVPVGVCRTLHCLTKMRPNVSLCMGISDEIVDAAIAIYETTILEVKVTI